MPIFENNRQLLDQFRGGAREALAAVYRRYVDDVALLVRRGFTMDAGGVVHVRGARDAEAERDLVQETFLRAFAEPARRAYDGLRPYRPYLLRITKNLMVDRFRARRREAAAAGDSDSATVGGSDGADAGGARGVGDIDALLAANGDLGDDGREMEADLDWKALRAAAAEVLGREARRFVALRFEEELSQDEVAARMRVSRRRVRRLEDGVQAGLARHLETRGLSGG